MGFILLIMVVPVGLSLGDDISTGMFLLFSSGVLLWLLYGIALNATPIIVANSITLILALTIILLKMRYRNRDAAEES